MISLFISTRRRIVATLATGAIVSIALVGCVPEENLDPTVDQGGIPTHVDEVTFGDTPVGERAQWIVDEINGNNAINKKDWFAKVAPELTEEIPVDSLVGVINSQVRPSGPFVASEYSEPQENVAVVRLTPDLSSTPLDMTVSLNDEGLLDGLWFVPAGDNQAEKKLPDEDETKPNSGLNQ